MLRAFAKARFFRYKNYMQYLVFSLIVLFALPSFAQQLVASHGDWRVLSASKNGGRICYLAATPSRKEGNYNKRGDAYFLVTHRSGNQDEVSVSSGYPYKENADVVLQFGQTRHLLFSKGEVAWAYDAKSDRDIVKDMIRGKDVVVRGTSWKGTFSKDTYSLDGFTAAHREMKSLCR